MNNQETREAIRQKIKSYSRIILSRHIRPDGDAVGSTMGLAAVLRARYPEKEIYVVNDDTADYTAFMGTEDAQPDDAAYADALLIALDTGTFDRLSNTKAGLAKEIIKIDHHIDDKPYGDLSLVEDFRSSACELVVDFCLSFAEDFPLTAEAAACFYVGMVTDSGRFRYSETTGDTLRLAGALLDFGIDTERLFAHLYLDPYEEFRSRSALLRKIRRSPAGVLSLTIPRSLRKKLGLTMEQASAAVSLMDSVKGSPVWIAFIEADDGTIRVRLRSRFIGVQELATRYHGGGHLCASGATVYSKKEAGALLREADALLSHYQLSHEDIL